MLSTRRNDRNILIGTSDVTLPRKHRDAGHSRGIKGRCDLGLKK